jgi:hypothetical protein
MDGTKIPYLDMTFKKQKIIKKQKKHKINTYLLISVIYVSVYGLYIRLMDIFECSGIVFNVVATKFRNPLCVLLMVSAYV